MAGPFPYRPGFGPLPAPAHEVTISWRGRPLVLEGLIDSGASRTVIPESLVDDLNLRKIAEVSVRGYAGPAEIRSVYNVHFDLAGLVIANLPVTVAPKTYVLVGRDVLRRYTTTLYGRQSEFTLA